MSRARPLSEITKEELVATLEKRRKSQREYHARPEVKEKQREYQRKYQRKVAAGYAAAKAAGLI